MAAKTKQIDVIYVETMATVALLVTLGDSIRGQDWARGEYPNDQQLQDERGSMYAVFLYEGTHEGLDAFYQQVYNVELERHGLSTRDGQHLERYPTSADPERFVAQAWIPVTARHDS